MVRFATDCMNKMLALAKHLDIIYGPDTSDLSLRIGIHSGPVTGGFLKGKGARFQLFGDTMNTTSRIESAGEPGRIHCSKETADLIVAAGKAKWVEKRENTIYTKGKGEMQTYWIDTTKKNRARRLHSTSGSSSAPSTDESTENSEMRDSVANREKDASGDKKNRLVTFNLEVLLRLLKQVVAWRTSSPPTIYADIDVSRQEDPNATMPLDEVKEIIALPPFDRRAAKRKVDIEQVVIPPVVVNQMLVYVTRIAYMYRNNPFHNFAHASHVVTAVMKLMNRIAAPVISDESRSMGGAAAALHDHTYGIVSLGTDHEFLVPLPVCFCRSF